MSELTQERLAAVLGTRPFQYHASLGSSNDIAQGWLREGAEAGAVVIADEQRTGRGRLGRTWYTPPDEALALSLIVRPEPRGLSRISILAALAVAEMCEEIGIDSVRIKWPNDVQIHGRKICGVLPEAVWEGDRLLGVVLGIGVNVRVQFHDAELASRATNLEAAAGRTLDRADLIARLLGRIDVWLPQLMSLDLLNAWRSRLGMLGQMVEVERVRGIAESVDENGALLMRLPDGSLHRALAGDLWLLDDGH